MNIGYFNELPYKKKLFIGISISLMANSLKLNSANYDNFGNLSMIAFVIKIQKSKSSNI